MVTATLVTESLTWVAVAAWTGASLSALMTGWLSSSLVGHGRPSGAVMLTMASRSRPYVGIMLVTLALQHLDLLVIGATRSAEEVGTYAAAYRLYAFAVLLLGLAATATYPALVRLHGSSRPGFHNATVELLEAAAAAGVALGALIAFTAPDVITRLFGEEYSPAINVLRILGLVLPLSVVNTALVQILLASGLERQYFRAALTTTIFIVVALVVTVPTLGTLAAAAVMLVGEILSVVLLTRRTVHDQGNLHWQAARVIPWFLVPTTVTGAFAQLMTNSVFVIVPVWVSVCLILEILPRTSLRHRTLDLIG